MEPGEKAWLRYVAAIARPLVFRSHRKFELGSGNCLLATLCSSCYCILCPALSACWHALYTCAHLIPHVIGTKVSFLGWSKAPLEPLFSLVLLYCKTCKKRAETSNEWKYRDCRKSTGDKTWDVSETHDQGRALG